MEKDCLNCEQTFLVPIDGDPFEEVCPACTASHRNRMDLPRTITVSTLGRMMGIPVIKIGKE